MGKPRGGSHYQLKLKAGEFLQKLGYFPHEEYHLDLNSRVDVFGVSDTGRTAVVECGAFPYERRIKLYEDKKVDRLYWWKFGEAEPFVLRLCNGCLGPYDDLNRGYLICSTLPKRRYIVGTFKEPCFIMEMERILNEYSQPSRNSF